MTAREKEILYIIYNKRGACSKRCIQQKTGLSYQYIELVIQPMVKDGLLEAHGRGAWSLTSAGYTTLRRRLKAARHYPPVFGVRKLLLGAFDNERTYTHAVASGKALYKDIQKSVERLTMK